LNLNKPWSEGKPTRKMAYKIVSGSIPPSCAAHSRAVALPTGCRDVLMGRRRHNLPVKLAGEPRTWLVPRRQRGKLPVEVPA
jgi:hypothetical protein